MDATSSGPFPYSFADVKGARGRVNLLPVHFLTGKKEEKKIKEKKKKVGE